MSSGGVEPGWYPDYERPPGHERYWDGERWTERRAGAAAPEPPTVWRPWVIGAVVAAVVLVLLVVWLGLAGGTDEGSSGGRSPAPPPTQAGSGERSWEVRAAVDGLTLRLSDGTEVRLGGLEQGCAPRQLAKLVVGQRVTLKPSGADSDDEGRLLRYVERDGLDVGKRLVQRGWAKASTEANPRRAIYRRIDERSPDACP